MRTLTEKMIKRLAAQQTEAKIQGLQKVAGHLDNVITTHEVRENDADYIYAAQDLQHDVEAQVWQGIARAMDYYDCHPDVGELYPIVEKMASDLIEEIRVAGRVRHGVGAYEPNVPGEAREKISIEICEDE